MANDSKSRTPMPGKGNRPAAGKGAPPNKPTMVSKTSTAGKPPASGKSPMPGRPPAAGKAMPVGRSVEPPAVVKRQMGAEAQAKSAADLKAAQTPVSAAQPAVKHTVAPGET